MKHQNELKVDRTDVFAIHGADPEVLAYAMAKYSRSALSMKDSLKEISAQKASEFLNTFYFQYGHKSIADLAHIPFAIENISLLAAIEVVDEQRWDGQERSTRYQDFSKRLYYTPEGLDEVQVVHYHKAIHEIFDAYDAAFEAAYRNFTEQNPKPEGMDQAAYVRTVKARAFDVARYLLPMATLTSVGQVVNARTLEGQISRMLGSPYSEVSELAVKLKEAASEPAYNPEHVRIEDAIDEISDKLTPEETKTLKAALLREVEPAPTLVKYTYASDFARATATFLKEELAQMSLPLPNELPRYLVEAHVGIGPTTEIVATLFYEHSYLPFEMILRQVQGRSQSWRDEILTKVLSFRGPHDELPHAFRVNGGVIFDIHMDIGGMRDMHRHRRATQIAQDYTADAFDHPEPMIPEVNDIYVAAKKQVRKNYEIMRFLRASNGQSPEVSAYLLPLGAKRRFLMKMDLAELAYIAELRTGPAGHITYRRVAWEMYHALKRISPALAAGIADRVTDPDEPLDFFKR